jgi:hypothetical protein
MDSIGAGGIGGVIGMPEVVVILVLAVLWLVPLAAGIWALFTLHRIRISQDAVRATLESIEKLLQRT